MAGGSRLLPGPGIALCHEWLAERRGSERTFEAMAEALPGADLYALTLEPSVPFSFGNRRVTTTLLDRIPSLRRHRALQLPLMPLAWRYASRNTYDVVVTSSHACAKGFWPARSALHLCYCYTPMRYLWLAQVDQRGAQGRLTAAAARWLRSWDRSSVSWVDSFAAISSAVQDRIATIYARPARVIHPPVDTRYFTPPRQRPRPSFVLSVSRMVPYKRLDVAVRACRAAGLPLVVAGSGPDEGRLRRLARDVGANVRFVIAPDDDQLRELYRRAQVLLFPAEEDFGIVPVEAQACGCPVVAYGRGGALDTVVPGVTGLLVDDDTPKSFASALEAAMAAGFDAVSCRTNAERFGRERFRDQFLDWIAEAAANRGISLEASLAGSTSSP